jgi:hypothetical protein
VHIFEIPASALLRVFESQAEYKIPECARWQTAQRLVGYFRGVQELSPSQIRDQLLKIREQHFENYESFTVKQIDDLVRWSSRIKSNKEKFDGRYTPKRSNQTSSGLLSVNSLHQLEIRAVGFLRVDPSSNTKLKEIIEAFMAYFEAHGARSSRPPNTNAFSLMLKRQGFMIRHTKRGNVWNVDVGKLTEATEQTVKNASASLGISTAEVVTVDESHTSVAAPDEASARLLDQRKLPADTKETSLKTATCSRRTTELDGFWSDIDSEPTEQSILELERQWDAMCKSADEQLRIRRTMPSYRLVNS